ncbi:MAG TPA: 50S ribosomal protein L11 methyltransferase [Gaiellaceae bacterium]|nr:50S ribosomal protein L11 methyltransferase [Gaiellaceae bacterium]
MSARVSRERIEEARALMLELFPDGFEELDAAEAVELAAYTGREGEERFRRAFPEAAGQDVAPGWLDAWKAFHRPVRVGPLWVGPPWHSPPADAIPVVIDPGRAFGTGGHATTRLCLELLLACERGSLVDLGCGSGVLAIAAAKLGFAPVTALDADPAAVEAAARNVTANGVVAAVERADVLADALPDARVAVANIARDPVERVGARLGSMTLVASGYPRGERPAPAGWRHVEGRETDGWAADRYVRL